MTDGGLASAILADVLARAGVPLRPGEEIGFAGADPVFPTTHRMGELGAAAIAAAALQAARLYEDRTGRAQRVDVEVDAAAAAMRSWRYLRQEPLGPRLDRAPVGFYETRDGRWILLHMMLEHHHARALAVLGCTGDVDPVAAAVRGWDGAALEEAIVAAGGCAALVRSAEEWAAHPQARAIAGLPLFRLTRTGDSAPEPAGEGARPLGGIRVVDATRVLAGPTAARALAEFGADVIRVNPPHLPELGPMPLDTGHGKRSTELDLRTSEGVAAMRALVAGADVFSQGYRPGSLERHGLSAAELTALRPGLVTVSISAWGASGPWADRRGYDSLVQAASGVSAETGGAGERPRSLPGNPLDYVTGYLAAFLVEVALGRRAREGGSYHVELSLAQTGRYLDDLPRVDADEAAAAPPELAPERLDALMMEGDTPAGRLRHLRPVARLPLTPAGWDRPAVPRDHDAPRW